jgi:transketolase
MSPNELTYVPLREFRRIRDLDGAAADRVRLFGSLARINTLYAIARAGSGHVGSSFSSLDIVSWILIEELDLANRAWGEAGIYFSSKGHDAPGFYVALAGVEALDFDLIHRLRDLGGLPGHPDVHTPCVEANSGSLGMGISKAKGMCLAGRLRGRPRPIYVMTGDGELQEGQIWESLASAAALGMDELTVIVDHNKFQSDTSVESTSDLGDLEAKFRAFGWSVNRCDGHDLEEFAQTLCRLEQQNGKPKVILADTIKGKGVSFMEHTAMEDASALYRYHSGAPSPAEYAAAVAELRDSVDRELNARQAAPLQLERVSRPASAIVPGDARKMIPAYTEALLAEAERTVNLVVLDADLILDCGLIPFRERYPEKFVECGIAEMDMVSQAGGLALGGMIPVVHSFACFLSARPNEQIFANATERTRIVYVGSLAGLLPGGPGHSHQSVRDIALLAAIPGMILLEPSCPDEIGPALEFCVHRHTGPSYLRLTSIPWSIPFALPRPERLEVGKGRVLRDGEDAIAFAYGPIPLCELSRAAEILEERERIRIRVVGLPWLNRVDPAWLAETIAGVGHVFTVDNHFVKDGQGAMLAAAIARLGLGGKHRVTSFGVEDVPVCGTNEQVLEAHGLSATRLATRIADVMTSRTPADEPCASS